MSKVMGFLIVNEDFDYSMTDIAAQSGVGYSTLKLFWKKLEESKIVKQTRVVGKAKMYRLILKIWLLKNSGIFTGKRQSRQCMKGLRKGNRWLFEN